MKGNVGSHGMHLPRFMPIHRSVPLISPDAGHRPIAREDERSHIALSLFGVLGHQWFFGGYTLPPIIMEVENMSLQY